KRTEKFTTFKPKGESFSIEKTAFDNHETVWIATSNRGVWTYNLKTKLFKAQTSIFPTKKAKNIFVSEEGVVFVSSDDAQTEAYNPHTSHRKVVSFKSTNSTPVVVQSMTQFASTELLLGTNQGV